MFSTNAQNFHKIYLLEDTAAIVHNIFPTDSCYYFAATKGNGGSRVQSSFGKLDLYGNVVFFTPDQDIQSKQFSSSSRTELDTNYRGNFIFSYTNEDSIQVPRITEMDSYGIVQFDSVYRNFQLEDSLEIFHYGRTVYSDQDSSYYLYLQYYDLTTDQGLLGNEGQIGVLVAKLNSLGDTLWMKKFHHPSTALNSPSYLTNDLKFLSDTMMLVSFMEADLHAPSNAEQDWCKLHFMKLDTSGQVWSQNIYQYSQLNWGGFATYPLADGGVILSHFVGVHAGSPPNNDYLKYQAVLARLDQNFNVLWFDTIQPSAGNYWPGQAPEKLISVNDTTFAGVYHYWNPNLGNETYTAARIFKKHIDGSDIWVRDYNYFFSPQDSLIPIDMEFMDIERTYDEGLIVCGNMTILDSLSANVPGQYGYVIKTNCLGFLEDPVAAASFIIHDSAHVTFHNESIMAGSYIWDFGDGIEIETGELLNTVKHEYHTSGVYQVTLIALGCQGANDTLTFTVNMNTAELNEPISMIGENNALTIFPNPAEQGGSLAFYIGSIDNATHHIDVYDNQGAIVDSFKVNTPKSTYFYPVNYSAGMYHFVLRKNGSILETEKLVIIE